MNGRKLLWIKASAKSPECKCVEIVKVALNAMVSYIFYGLFVCPFSAMQKVAG